jgi:hypothetical protein
MHLKISIENDGDDEEPFILKVDRTVLALCESQRLAVAKAFVCASFRLCPPPIADDSLGPMRVELATFMNAAVQNLPQTAEDRRRGSWWQAVDEQPDALAAHGLN